MPLPAGLSGAVITATILHPSTTSLSKMVTAKSGVPMNTNLHSFKGFMAQN
jgi:hypothetical protein